MHAVYEPPLWITQETSRANPDFHHGLLAAVLTSQMAGAWLDYVLRRGWPLLTPAATGEAAIVSAEESPSAA